MAHRIEGDGQSITGATKVPLAGVYALLSLLVAGVAVAVTMFARIEDNMRTRFVSREVFEAEMDSLKKEIQYRHDTVMARLSELSAKLEAVNQAARGR
jgi:hypothetical protein